MSTRKLSPAEVCNRLMAWAAVAELSAPGAGTGTLVVAKSDLLGRLMHGGEQAPSATMCPVHKGKWSGIHLGWPDTFWTDADGNKTPVDVSPTLQEWWDAGCRCATHKGSTSTTGWQPDSICGCVR